MTYLCAALLVVLNALGLGLVVLGLPGNWLMVLFTLLAAWWRLGTEPAAAGRPMFGVPVLVAICVLALVGEAFELLAGMFGSQAAGGSRRGALGALLGAVVGGVLGTFAIPIPVLGSLLGTCGGAAIGAWGLEFSGGRSSRASLKAGVGAGVGRLAGTLAKLAVGIAIWITVAIAAFWP
jgi:uncharacterized protein YqgC (DUF456 family)